MHRLKNKIGTHTLPTAELSLEGAQAYLIGAPNQGIKNIAPVLNITRLWSAIGSVGALRRCLAIATAYARVRTVRGGALLLSDAPLHVAQLAGVALVYRALTHLTFGAVRLLGKAECGVAMPDELRRLRMLTPTAKAFVAEKACAGMEEAMTALGGAGYMEENGFGRLIRDSLVEKCVAFTRSPQEPSADVVHRIWEGTTTVLALDLARAAQDPATLKSFTVVCDPLATPTRQPNCLSSGSKKSSHRAPRISNPSSAKPWPFWRTPCQNWQARCRSRSRRSFRAQR